MCEPMHSIVQYQPPENDDDDKGGGGSSGGSGGDNWMTRFKDVKNWKWVKSIGRFLHVSRMGMGHSETATDADLDGSLPRTLYEASWWKREVRMDGSFQAIARIIKRHNIYDPVLYRLLEQARPQMEAEGLTKATEYANLVSIGSLHHLRQFLEASMAATNSVAGYLERFRLMLNGKGVMKYEQQLEKLGVVPSPYSDVMMYHVPRYRGKDRVQSLINLCMGLTRKRELLVPCWADDGRLWTPGQEPHIRNAAVCGSQRVVG